MSNAIEFTQGGGLFVTGTLSADPNQLRNNFKFNTAQLDLKNLGNYNFPPIGQGWFDTIYLDDDLRCDVNSRKDILICTQAK